MKKSNEPNDFLKQRANFAVVINCDLDTIERIKRFFADENIKVIYQRTSLGRLFIQEERTK